MMDKATLRFRFAYCLVLQVVLSSLVPCPCLLAVVNSIDVRPAADAEPGLGVSGKTDCRCFARRMARLPVREVHAPALAHDGLVAPSPVSTAPSKTHLPSSLCASTSDVVTFPDIHETEFLRE